MRTQSEDTHPAAEAVQVQILRAASRAERSALSQSLSQSTIEMSRRARRRLYPELPEVEIRLSWVANHYGEDLARRLRTDLTRRGLL